MSLRVAFDMDGTVADMHTVLRSEAERLFGSAAVAAPAEAESVPPDGPVEAEVPLVVATGGLRLDPSRLEALWDHVQRIENFWTLLPEAEAGIVARIADTARTRRWEVLFITTRPTTAGDTTQLQTQRWLPAHGFEYPSVCVLQRSRGRLADVLQLDVVVDDRPENCVDVAVDSKARPLLIWPGAPETLPPGLQRVGVRPMTSIGEALSWLERLDDSRQQSAVVRSIRRLFRRDEMD